MLSHQNSANEHYFLNYDEVNQKLLRLMNIVLQLSQAEKEKRKLYFKVEKMLSNFPANSYKNLPEEINLCEETEFTYLFHPTILNNKKVQWEVKINNLSGWLAFGICVKEIQENIYGAGGIGIKRNEKYSRLGHGCFMITSDKKKINFLNADENRAEFKNIPNMKSGDKFICQYTPKFEKLKIYKSTQPHNEITLTKIKFFKNEIDSISLVPCILVSSPSDEVEFDNFSVLADYKEKTK